MRDRPNCPCGDRECVGCTSGPPEAPMTPKCPKNHGDTLTDGCCCGGDNGVHLLACPVEPPAPPVSGLDFAAAEKAGDAAWDASDPIEGPVAGRMEATEAYQSHLDRQLAERVAAARAEERAKGSERADAALWLSRSALWTHIPQLAKVQGPGFGTTMFEAIAELRKQYPDDFPLDEVGDSALASLRASHQEVTRIVREWQEARKAKLDLEDDPSGTHSRTTITRVVEREAEARFALAALDLGGAE